MNMSQSKLYRLLGILLATFCIIALPQQAQAAPKGKAKPPQQVQKERLVLLPMDISEEGRAMYGQQESAVVEGLAQKYEVFSGERVMQELRKASSKENARAKGPCDETRCLEDVAIALQAENVAMVHVTKIEGGYLLSLSIKNVMTNQAVFDKSLPCEGCNVFKVIDKLKELGVTPAPAEETPPAKANLSDPETALWEEAKKGNTAEDYQAYLSTYPKGKYAPLAKTKLNRLKEEAKAALAQQDQQAWGTAQQGGTLESYAAYLSLYPQGQFVALATARISKLRIFKDCADCPEMVVVPAGSFDMGSNNGEAEEKPVHRVTIGKAFALGKTEVTQGQWKAVMGNNPSNFKNCGDNCPVEQVSWDDAQAFIQKLNAQTGKQYRLPSEAEWEYACHAASQSEYCGGDNIDSVAWHNGNSGRATHPSARKQANAWGLYDMSGNVSEWTADSYHYSYNGAPGDGTEWPGDGRNRVLLGGSWYDNAQSTRAANRGSLDPAARYFFSGFRLARTLP